MRHTQDKPHGINSRRDEYFTMRMPRDDAWHDLARLVATSIPNYLVSQLGQRFGAVYYQHLARHPKSFCLGAYDETDNLAGCILATMDRRTAYKLTITVAVKLLVAANIRLLSTAFLVWLVRGLGSSLQSKSSRKHLPAAELIILVVAPAFHGKGLASQLVEEMEVFFKANGLSQPYLILTEQENLVANKYYKKIGAEFIQTYWHHGRAINHWQQSLQFQKIAKD